MKACYTQGAGLGKQMFANLTCKFCGSSYKGIGKRRLESGKLKCKTCGNDRFWGNKD